MYMDGHVKLSSELVETLKKHNNVYPLCSADYDVRFLYKLCIGVFAKDDFIESARTGKIQHLDRIKLKFVKGTSYFYE